MPALIAPPVGLCLGACFAWAARDELARASEGALRTRACLLVLTFTLAIYGPLVAVFLALAPDWCLAYLAPVKRLPSGATLGLLLSAMLALPVGFLIAAPLAARRNAGTVIALAGAPALASLAFLLVGSRRLSVLATYHQYHADYGAQPITESGFGLVLLAELALLLGACVWTLRTLGTSAQSRRR